MAARHIRLSLRGLVLAGTGLGAVVAGALIGVVVVVQVGALLLLTALTSVALLVAEAHRQERGGLALHRRVVPHPVTVGDTAVVEVELSARRQGRPAPRVDRLQIAERAARELSGAAPLRARVQRARDRLTLSYSIRPELRGRWMVGPVQVNRRDLFGVADWTGPLGQPALVSVRPWTAALAVSSAALSSALDRVAAGARSPAPDDTTLRDYRTGDDLRRVHWRSSARRGELVVRQDERSGRRPASVLLDLPLQEDVGEWTISMAASIAIALARTGHHVRLLGGGVHDAAAEHHRPDLGGAAVDALLEQTVDLHMPDAPAERDAWMAVAVDTVHTDGAGSELLFAVVGALEHEVLRALARSGASSGWAMVRTSETGDALATTEAETTARRLRRAGWTVCLVRPGEDLRTCWERLTSSDDRTVMAR
jgi:uncharacterized protein (DUF58 family)